MRLPWDEFNRVQVAGIPNTVRLSTMLDAAAIAFLVFTAEDETADGRIQARMNVIHEAGLFQGRLGFNRAIILLEEGCDEFSNIEGLGQIRFPKNNIRAAFHDIQLVLERERLIDVLGADQRVGARQELRCAADGLDGWGGAGGADDQDQEQQLAGNPAAGEAF